MTTFAGASVLVTGAASGIGAATAHMLKESGARLILMDRNAHGLDQFVEDRRVVGDVCDTALWMDADLGGLTHAVINAGVAAGGPHVADLDFAEWRRIMDVNLDGAFLSLSAAMRAIRATGKGGAVVVTASIAGIKPQPGTAAYSASKAALIQLAKVAALEGAPDGIRVNAYAPSGVVTPIWTGTDYFRDLVDRLGGEEQAFDAMGRDGAPLGRFALPAEAARQILFLLSEESALMTGSVLVADGGYSL